MGGRLDLMTFLLDFLVFTDSCTAWHLDSVYCFYGAGAGADISWVFMVFWSATVTGSWKVFPHLVFITAIT
jgi:hypothetical protein